MLKRVTLELGGKSPNIILPDADLKAAVAGSFTGIYFNTGQACNAGSRLFVHRDQFDDVVAALAERAAKSRVGPGLDPSTQLGPVVSEQRERVMSYIEAGRSEGAELVTGGESDDGTTAATSSRRRCSRPPITTSGSPVRRSLARYWSRSPTNRSKRSRRAPTTPNTASRPGFGPVMSATLTGWRPC
jgi:hypothetical protein